MQHLLARAKWDADGVRDDVRGYVIDCLGDPGAALVVDETGDVKKGTATACRPLHGPAGERPVLCVDEKSQVLDRTAPCLPMLPTTPARMTHDYVRNGTASLFAAFDLASGSVIAQPYRRNRHQEFLRFLKLIDAAVPDGLDLHLVLDNYATH
jgi:SRSO17 transposase